MIEVMHRAGFRNACVCGYFDSFLGTTKEAVARKYGVRGANFVAYKASRLSHSPDRGAASGAIRA
jgi:hypothetical protein